MNIVEHLSRIQRELNAPKSQFNSFGKYKYRNCEDILMALKPHLKGVSIIVTDDLKLIGDRYYVHATAVITDGTDNISASAFAREPLDKKGMDASQITGAASSYARKYALSGLLLIDDNKDADSKSPEDNEPPIVSDEQIQKYHQIIESGKGMELLAFTKTLTDEQNAALPHPFKQGEITQGKQKIKKMLDEGVAELDETVMNVKQLVALNDISALEWVENLSSLEKKLVAINLEKHELDKLKEMKENAKEI